jgi:hypothetical protein
MGGPAIEDPVSDRDRSTTLPTAISRRRAQVAEASDDPRSPVQAVADATTSLMALLYGGFLGTLSALLVVGVVSRMAPETLTPFQRAALGLVAWVASTWWFSANADKLVIVFRRAFALGALEWSTLSVVGQREPVAMAATGMGRGLGAPAAAEDLLVGGLAMAMIVACLAGWLVCRWWSPPAQEVEAPAQCS